MARATVASNKAAYCIKRAWWTYSSERARGPGGRWGAGEHENARTHGKHEDARNTNDNNKLLHCYSQFVLTFATAVQRDATRSADKEQRCQLNMGKRSHSASSGSMFANGGWQLKKVIWWLDFSFENINLYYKIMLKNVMMQFYCSTASTFKHAKN